MLCTYPTYAWLMMVDGYYLGKYKGKIQSINLILLLVC